MVDSEANGAGFMSADKLRAQAFAQAAEAAQTMRGLFLLGFGFANANLEDAELSVHEARLLDGIERDVSAAAIAHAGTVLRRRLGSLATQCCSCGRRGPFARVIVHKPTSCGKTEATAGMLAAGLCADCARETSTEFRGQVSDLVRAAERLEQVLALVQRAAARELGPWWGTLGACRAEEADAARVEVRRAIERMKMRAS
jgi:hypothetical protein